MTGEEVSRRYEIPNKILEEYRQWGLCGAVRIAMAEWQYNDQDLERLSMIMALHDMGFSAKEGETYMRLFLQGPSTEGERLVMLDKRRRQALVEIHLREKQLERLDYLRHELRENQR